MGKAQSSFKLVLGRAAGKVALPSREERKLRQVKLVRATKSPYPIVRALRESVGAAELISKIPNLAKAALWSPVARFSVCSKSGTAAWLDIWDDDHFDGFTDMARCVRDCRVWFSADGYTTWGSSQTRTGRINCYFRAPSAGNYVCNAQLQSYGGPARVECLIDSYNFGALPFSGPIDQPHPMYLSAGYHSFKIRQLSGSFFFISLTVWKV